VTLDISGVAARAWEDVEMKEVALDEVERDSEAVTFAACVATILELPLAVVPRPEEGQDPSAGWALSRWLGDMGLGLAPVANPASFSWAGPGWHGCGPPDDSSAAQWSCTGFPPGSPGTPQG